MNKRKRSAREARGLTPRTFALAVLFAILTASTFMFDLIDIWIGGRVLRSTLLVGAIGATFMVAGVFYISERKGAVSK